VQGLSRQLMGNFLGLVCMIAWSTNFIIADDLLATWHPVLLTPARSGVAALVLCLAVVAMGQGRQLLQIPVIHMVGAGGIGLSVSNLLFVWGQNYVDPVSAAIILSCLPVISVIFGWIGGTERLGILLCMGIALAVVGGVLASLGVQSGAAGEGSILGAVMILTGTVFYIWYTRTLVAICPNVSVLAKAAVCMLMSTLMCLIYAEFAVLLDMVPLKYDVSLVSLGKLFWFGAIAIGGSTALWFATGQMVGVTIAAMHHNMVPFYVMLFALAAGGTISGQTLAGAGLVAVGAVLAQLPALAVARRSNMRTQAS
ncbi:MAG: DMT family transporter, partial [Aestuariivirgaceae bacterium]